MNRAQSLRFRIKLITFTAIGVLFVMTLVYVQGFDRMARERANAYFESGALEAENRLVSHMQNIAAAADMTASSSTLQTYLLAASASARMQVMAASVDIMQKTMNANVHLFDILLYSKAGRLLFARGGSRPVALKMLEEYDLYADANLRVPFFTHTYVDKTHAIDRMYAFYVTPIYNTLPGQFSADNAGLCAIQFKVDTLCGDLRAREQPQSFVTIVMEGDKLLSTNCELPPEDVELLNLVGAEQTRSALSSSVYLARLWVDGATGWKVITAAPIHVLESDILPLKRLGMILFIISMLLLGILMFATVRSISVPLGGMLRDIDRIGSAREGFRMRLPRSHELALIADQINRMLKRVEDSAHSEKEAQAALFEASISRQRAELLFYRSQINPHFLYNTLECIRAMAQHYAADGIEKICLSMSRMFRYSLRNDERVTVKDELSNVRDYFTVMTERMNGIYKLIISVTPEASERPMQKMILQPIVENAIKHGLSEKEPPCNICIQGYIDGNRSLLLRVTDNGVGMSGEALKGLQESVGSTERVSRNDASIGLSNIDHRLRLSFGDKYALAIRSRQGYYTSIELTLPPA